MGTRGIDNCVDCSGARSSLGNGPFVRAGLDFVVFTPTQNVGLGLNTAYQRYFGAAGFTDEIGLSLAVWL